MSTITTINSSDVISNSRSVINTNFSNLNTDKAELSGGTFTGPIVFSGSTNSGLKVNSLSTTQRDALTPANGMLIYNTTINQTQVYENGVWNTPTAAATNASTTVAGIVEEATQAEVDAGTTSGGTTARLFVNPSTVRSKLLSDYVADTGAADAYVITPSPAITSYTTGQIFTFKASATNTTTSTLAVNGLAAKTIKRSDGATNLTAGDIVNGQIVQVEYDGTNFQLGSPSAKGIVGTLGTSANNIVQLNGSAQLPAVDGSLLTSVTIYKNGLNSSRAANTASGSQTIAHGLGSTPKFLRITAACTVDTTQFAQSIGTYNGSSTATVEITSTNTGNGTVNAGTNLDTTNIIRLENNHSGAAGNQVATVTLDATNINLSWTLSGTMSSNNMYLLWEVYK